MHCTSFRLSHDIINNLQSIAKARGISVSELVRERLTVETDGDHVTNITLQDIATQLLDIEQKIDALAVESK